jgi:formylglycine-generating enzyme required for sulfatase activity
MGSVVVAVPLAEMERASPRWGWGGLGAVVMVFSAVMVWVKFGEEQAGPVEPTAEPAPGQVDPSINVGGANTPNGGTPTTPEPKQKGEPKVGGSPPQPPEPQPPGPPPGGEPPAQDDCGVQPTGGTTGKTHKPQLPGLDMTFVGLSNGSFCMGSPEDMGEDDERPQRQVTVSGFMLGKSEVTQAQWKTVVLAAQAKNDPDAAALDPAPSRSKGDKLPVVQVSWCDVTRFANALSGLEGHAPVYQITVDAKKPKDCTVSWLANGKGYRLPTEAE